MPLKPFLVRYDNNKCVAVEEYDSFSEANNDYDSIMTPAVEARNFASPKVPKARLIFAENREAVGVDVGDIYQDSDDMDFE